jgi:hypothetical protein
VKTRPIAVVCLVALAAMTCAAAVDYGKTMANKVRQALGAGSTQHFKFATYPVNNFGIATAYDQNGTELCATWTCLTSDNDVPTDPDALLSLTTKAGTRYADVGSGSPITLSDDQKRDIGFQVLLPQLLKVIDVTIKVNNNKDIQTDMDLGAVVIRKIIPDRITARIQSLPSGSSERVAFDNRQLRLVCSDIVAKSLKVTLTVDATANADIDAKLTSALSGQVGNIIGGKGTDLSLKVDSATKGKYVLDVASPVIIATLTKRQPASGHLDASGIQSWPNETNPVDKIFTYAP